jgi:polysaccharide deacetylase family protein (PEP-CTERM system associated)
MNILTFDIEEWFHILDHEATDSSARWDGFESRIRSNIGALLSFLGERDQKATFFCLGWVAERYPEVIRQIDGLGFEIGTHSDLHQLVYRQGKDAFRADLERSVKRLEDLTGKRVRAYRAPGFSITPETPWAFDVLMECGIEIDCSIFTARRAHGGYPGFPCTGPCYIERGGNRIKEFPVCPYSIGPVNVIFSGGGYLRLMPYPAIRFMMRRSRYVMVYLHYRDFDYGQRMIKELPLHRKFKSYVGIKGAFAKLERLISDFHFIDLAAADAATDWVAVPTHGLGRAH